MMGATYLSLLASLQRDETLTEARRRQRPTTTVQHPSRRSLGASLLRSLRGR